MQPSNIKLTKKAKGLARAKMLINAHLYWLEGCPVFVENKLLWLCPFAAIDTVVITTKMVSKAQRTINELYKDFPIALPKIVGDSQQWFTRCHAYLDYYKQLSKNPTNAAFHSLFNQDSSFHKKYADTTVTYNPEIINALSWLHFIDRKPLKKSLAFISQNENHMHNEAIPLPNYLRLIHLFAQNGKRAKKFIDLIFKTATLNDCTEISDNHFNNHIHCKRPKRQNKSLKRPPIKVIHNTQVLLDLLKWLMQVKPIQRKRALLLISTFDLSQALLKWHSWWKKANILCLKIENIINYAAQSNAKQLLTQQKKLQNLQKTKPNNIKLSVAIAAIKDFSQHHELSQALQSLLSALPKNDTTRKYNYPTRIKFLLNFHMIYNYGSINKTQLSHYLKLLAKYIKAHPKTYKNAPWQQLEEYYWGTLESTLFDELKPAKFARFFHILSQVQQHEAINSQAAARIATLANSSFSDAAVISLSLYLLEHKKLGYIPSIIIKMMEYYDLNPQEILKLLSIWNKFNEEYTNDDTLSVMFTTFVEIKAAAIFKQLLFMGQANAMRANCYQVRIIKKLSSIKHVPPFQQNQHNCGDWIHNFPKIFHPQLQQLNQICPNAEKKTSKIFSAHWWSKPMLKAQIAQLQKQINRLKENHNTNHNPNQSDKLVPRLQNLTNKLKNHKAITQVEQNKIQSKLDTLITKETYTAWQQRLFACFKGLWIDFFELKPKQVPQWFLTNAIIYQLMPIIDFVSADKKLAIKVIKNRCQYDNKNDYQQWQLLNHPKNHQFILNMQQIGFDMQHWINGIASQTYQAKNNEPITLSIAKDPLEILNMGAYFKTCLSPTSFNYFSVFANIADINKQIIYAKNTRGKVIGRVLLGLTDNGGLMTYHLYQHNAQLGFHKFALKYINNWAKQIGLTLTNKGEVSTLVATNWYDDGAIEVDNGISCFKQDSKFRKALATLTPENFQQTFITQLKPAKLTPQTFSMLLNLPELPENNALFPKLIELAQQLTFLHEQDKIILYKLSHAMGFEHYYPYFRTTVVNYQNKKLKKEQCLDRDLALLMAKNKPTDALTLIKKYGKIKSKNWQKNLHYHNHEIAVIALKNLGRMQQADEIKQYYENS